MQPNFSFHPDTHDFWKIFQSIIKFYPIGIERGEKGLFFAYPGIKKLNEIIIENIHNPDHFKNRWTKFTTGIGLELNKEIIGTTLGQAPSFSSAILLQKETFGRCTHVKELHFAVSLVGEFYQIYGKDGTLILETNKQKGYASTNVITTSPFEEYQASFDFVASKIKERYPNHKMVPYSIGQMIIRGLQVRYSNEETCTVNHALFNDYLSDTPLEATRGDRNYGMDAWERRG